jgi:Stage III sporulation protein AF (Spore_III_AF).
MSAIRQWAFSLCCAMVAAAVARMLLPNSSLQKMFQAVLSVFILCALLSPLVLSRPQLQIWVEEYSSREIERRAAALKQVAEKQTQQQAEEEMRKIVDENLEKMGIKGANITIHINVDEQGAAPIAEAVVLLPEEYAAQQGRIHKQLADALGTAVRLEWESEGEANAAE